MPGGNGSTIQHQRLFVCDAPRFTRVIHRTRTVWELRHNGALKFSVEVGLLPVLFLDACLRRAHAMGDVHRRADFVGGRR
jgi:hypothetical protein